VFSPTLQTLTIKCTNGTSTRIHFDQSTKIHVPAGCSIKWTTHEITSTDSAKISPPPLRYSWSWDPFTLPSSLLSNPAHIDQAIYELRTNIFGMSKQINTTRTNSSTFEQMISKTNFKINYASKFTWLALALAATANLGLFIFTIIYFFMQRQTPTLQTQQTPQTLSSIHIPNPTTEYLNQLPQQILQLQDMISHRQLVNINHNQLALR
jgi:hypothetical protein